MDRGEIRGVKQVRLEFQCDQCHTGVADCITMLHARRMIDAGEWLIRKLHLTSCLSIFTLQHERDKSGLVGMAGKRTRLSMHQSVHGECISSPAFRHVPEKLPYIERPGHGLLTSVVVV